MDVATIIASLSMLVAFSMAVLNYLRYRREEREENSSELTNAIKSEMQKEGISIKGAQGAIEIMERMLAVTAQSEAKLQKKVESQAERIEALESERTQHRKTIHNQVKRIEALERENETQRDKIDIQASRIRELEGRMDAFEKEINDRKVLE